MTFELKYKGSNLIARTVGDNGRRMSKMDGPHSSESTEGLRDEAARQAQAGGGDKAGNMMVPRAYEGHGNT
jgi:hypothetical protein